MTLKRATIVDAMLTLFAATLCWACVSWSLRPGLFPIMDEIDTRGSVMNSVVQPDPAHPARLHFYADRPLGWVFIKAMDDRWGFDYSGRRSRACWWHLFANCGLGFWLFRKLGASVPLSVAGIALFGGLWTTAQTAPYLDECFDAICHLFFLLGSILAMLFDHWMVSALLFFLALRRQRIRDRDAVPAHPLAGATAAARKCISRWQKKRLWLHYAIVIAIGVRYAMFCTVRIAPTPRRTALLSHGFPYRERGGIAGVLHAADVRRRGFALAHRTVGAGRPVCGDPCWGDGEEAKRTSRSEFATIFPDRASGAADSQHARRVLDLHAMRWPLFLILAFTLLTQEAIDRSLEAGVHALDRSGMRRAGMHGLVRGIPARHLFSRSRALESRSAWHQCAHGSGCECDVSAACKRHPCLCRSRGRHRAVAFLSRSLHLFAVAESPAGNYLRSGSCARGV